MLSKALWSHFIIGQMKGGIILLTPTDPQCQISQKKKFCLRTTSNIIFTQKFLFGKDLQGTRNKLLMSSDHMSSAAPSWQCCEGLINSGFGVVICIFDAHLWVIARLFVFEIFSWPQIDLCCTAFVCLTVFHCVVFENQMRWTHVISYHESVFLLKGYSKM